MEQEWKRLSNNEYKALWAIAQGYRTTGNADYLIVVENPDKNEPWDDDNLVIDMHEVAARNGEFDGS